MAGQSFEYDMRYVPKESYGLTAGLPTEPDMSSASALGKEVDALRSYWAPRTRAFERWDALRNLTEGPREVGLESMVTNDARTMFALAVFLASAAQPKRSVSIGSQGPRAQRKSGKSERAVSSWWSEIDERRLKSGLEPFRYDLAYWMCLYGWYATMYGVDDKGIPFATALDPSGAYPQFADGLARFVYSYDSTLAGARLIGKRYGTTIRGRDDLQPCRIAEWWHRDSEEGTCHHAIMASGLKRGWVFLAEPEEVNTPEIPVLCGSVAGSPKRDGKGQKDAGSVFYENERVYADFNRWLSFLMTLSKEHAQAPIIARNIEIDPTQLRPMDIRDTSAVITTDDPEAAILRVGPGPAVVEVQQFLGIIDAMLQRGGFPYIIYGGLGRELSGFAISQLLQAAERRIGPQVDRMAAIDSIISQAWLEDYKKGAYSAQTISGTAPGHVRELYVEKFGPKDVPEVFKVMTEIPIRVGNDLMARMSIARQAMGQGAILDLDTILEQILQMDDPTLIKDGMGADAARTMLIPLKAALELKMEAQSIRDSGKPGAEMAARLAEQMADKILIQPQQGQAPQAAMRPSAAMMPPEAAGVSPDVVKAAMGVGPTNTGGQ